MTPHPPARTLSLRSRLLIVAGLNVWLALLPTSLLVWHYRGELSFVGTELAALPANRAWQEVIAAAQAHRQSAAAMATDPQARARRTQAAADAEQAFQALDAALDAGHATAERRAAATRLRGEFVALAAAAVGQTPNLAELLKQHRDFTGHVFGEVSELNADAQLLQDPEPAAHFSIVAGLLEAPRVSDALSELSAVAAAAAVDDVALGPVIIWIAPAPVRQGMQRKAQAAGRGSPPAKVCNAAMRPLPDRPFG